jgi:predicted transcriptional regulator
VSTVQEIQEAIAKLPENELVDLIQWIHAHHDWNVEEDPEVMASIKEGERQLDAGEGVTLEEARKLARTWITK